MQKYPLWELKFCPVSSHDGGDHVVIKPPKDMGPPPLRPSSVPSFIPRDSGFPEIQENAHSYGLGVCETRMEPISVDQKAEERDAHEGSEQIELSKQNTAGEFVLMFSCGSDNRE